MKLVLGKILGNNREGEWSYVHDFTPVDEKREQTRGRLVAVIKIAIDENVTEVGREVLSRLNELYYGREETESFEALKSAVSKVMEELGEADLGCVVVVDKVVYLVVSGGIRVWVKRKSGEGFITGDKHTKGVKAFSGWVEEEMQIVMGNNQFWEGLGEGVVIAAVKRAETEETVERLTAMEHGEGDVGGVGVIVKVVETTLEQVDEENEEVVENEILTKKDENKPKVNLTKVKDTIKEGYEKVLEKIVGRKDMYIVRGEGPKFKLSPIKVGIGFLVFLLLMVILGSIRMKLVKEKEESQQVVVDQISAKFREAKSLDTMNPVRSRQLLLEVKSEIEALGKQALKSNEVIQMKNEFDEVMDIASGVRKIIGKELINLDLVRKDMKGVDMVAGKEGELWVLGNESRLVLVKPGKGSGEVVGGKQDVGENGYKLTYYPGKVVVVSNLGIVICDEVQVVCKVGVQKSDEWNIASGINMWAGNIYMVDTGANNLWKWQATDSGFGAKKEWLSKENNPVMLGGSIAIDGNVWVDAVLDNGESTIRQYSGGVAGGFSLAAMEKKLGGGVKLYTDEFTERLYVLDPMNSRVVVVDKETGEFLSQLKAEELSKALNLVVLENKKKLYILGETQVTEYDLP